MIIETQINPGDECVVVINYPLIDGIMNAGTTFSRFEKSKDYNNPALIIVGKWQLKGTRVRRSIAEIQEVLKEINDDIDKP